MLEITTPAIKIFKHRDFMDWHGPLVAKNPFSGCMNLNCPMSSHLMDESWHDPHSRQDIIAIPLGMRLLILTDYCDKEYVAYLTLREIYDPNGCTQLRFSEGSKRCWYFQPNGLSNGHSVYLDSLRYVAIVESDATAFGKFGGIGCFKRELSRLSGLTSPVINQMLRQLEKSIPIKPFGLKPWATWAQDLEEKFLNNDQTGFNKVMHFLCSSSRADDIVAFLMPCIQQGKLEEVMALTQGEKFICPDNFVKSFEKVKQHLTRSFPEIVKPASTWEEQWRQFFGV
jgi:hypothetical protein